MMNFRKVKDSIENILRFHEANRYITSAFQRQSMSAVEFLDNKRTVHILHFNSEFPKNASSLSGPVQNDAIYNLNLKVSKAAEGDVSAIINPTATQQEIETALANFSEASQLAENSINEFIDIIYQVLMDARNYDLGMEKGIVSNRWIDRADKDDPLPVGEYVILTAQLQLSCRIVEIVEGDTGIPGGKVFDTVVDIEGDDIEKSGVIVEG